MCKGHWQEPGTAYDRGAKIGWSEVMLCRQQKHLLLSPLRGQDKAPFNPSLSSILLHFLRSLILKAAISLYNARAL